MRWVSWAAVSSLPQAKKISIDDQLAENRRHAEKHGGQVVAELVVPGESRSIVLFEDAARKMQAYAELKRLVDARAFDVLVYLDRSRLGRKASLSMAVVELCQSSGIITYETENPPSTVTLSTSHDDALIGAIKSVGAQREIDKLRQRHEMGMADRVKRGKFPSTPPFGYIWRYHTDGSRTVEVDDAAAAVVRRVVALYLDGHGTPMVAEKMNEAGIASPLGMVWNKSSVQNIINRIWTYAGYAEVNKRSQKRQHVRAKGEHTGIVDEDTAQKVDAERASRLANRKLADTIYHLSGVVYCAECQRPMHCVGTYTARNGKRYDYISLKCIRHKPAKYASYARVMADFRATIEAIDEEQIEDLIQPDTSQQDAISGQIAEQEGMAERISASMQRADDAFVSGAMDDDRYRRQVDRLNAQHKATQNEIARLRGELADEQAQAKRRERIESVAAIGLEMLDGDATKCNIWLRRTAQVRLWVEDGQLIVVDYL